MANSFLICPADCNDDLNLGPLDEDQDCTNYNLFKAQVCDIIIKPNSAANSPIIWEEASPYEAQAVLEEIDNASIDGTKSKKFSGIGGIAEPEEIIENYPKEKTKVTGRTYTLIYDVLNLTDDQYYTLRQFQCGWTSFRFWYVSLGGFIYGGTDGIEPKSVKATFPKDAADGAKDKCTITIVWEADGDPDRNHTPF